LTEGSEHLIKCSCADCNCENATPVGRCFACSQGDHAPRDEKKEPKQLVWEEVTHDLSGEAYLYRARTPVGWLVAAYKPGKYIVGETDSYSGPMELVGVTFVPDSGGDKWQ